MSSLLPEEAADRHEKTYYAVSILLNHLYPVERGRILERLLVDYNYCPGRDTDKLGEDSSGRGSAGSGRR